MIKDKPFLGHGYGSFQAKYMDYQADYFKKNPNSKFAFLADNVKHPFNEFIKIAVEYGIAGLALILSIVILLLWKILKSPNGYKNLVFSGLVSFIVFGFFSYPLYYVAVWILLAIYLSSMLQSKLIEIKNNTLAIGMRSTIVIVCIFLICHVFMKIRAEIKWKTIAMSSLEGNTEEMLPEYQKLYSSSLKKDGEFLMNYGKALSIAGQPQKAIAILELAKNYQNNTIITTALGDSYKDTKQYHKAEANYKQAVNMIPSKFYAPYLLAKLYDESKQKEKAVVLAQQILNKKIKIPSTAIEEIQLEMKQILTKYKNPSGFKN